MTHASPEAGIGQDLLLDCFGRIREGVAEVLDGLSPEELLWRPDAEANHIAWLVWHTSRGQDEQVAHLAGETSVWRSGDWPERFALPYSPKTIGYGMSSADVGRFPAVDPELFEQYQDAVHELSVRTVKELQSADYARVIDKRWDPPVTIAVRLVSIIEDCQKHLGQAEYVRGLVERRRG